MAAVRVKHKVCFSCSYSHQSTTEEVKVLNWHESDVSAELRLTCQTNEQKLFSAFGQTRCMKAFSLETKPLMNE